jgi:hypothetical protein
MKNRKTFTLKTSKKKKTTTLQKHGMKYSFHHPTSAELASQRLESENRLKTESFELNPVAEFEDPLDVNETVNIDEPEVFYIRTTEKNANERKEREDNFFLQNFKDYEEAFLVGSGLKNTEAKSSFGCCERTEKVQKIKLVSSDSIISKIIHFCSCKSITYQLISNRYISGSLTSPYFAFSFDLLALFNELSINGGLSAYCFVNAIRRLSNDKEKAYKPFLKAMRWYRSIYSSLSHKTYSSNICLACNRKDHIHLAVDGCFRLQKRVKAGQNNELVKKVIYSKVEANVNNETFISECNEFKALKRSSKPFRHLEVTGVVGLFCARHGTILKIADMDKGEKFVYADYLIKSYLE